MCSGGVAGRRAAQEVYHEGRKVNRGYVDVMCEDNLRGVSAKGHGSLVDQEVEPCCDL